MKYLIALALLFLGVSAVSAGYNTKGMKVYKKLCVQCHGGPFRGSGMHTIDEWEEIKVSSNTPFISLHKDVPEALEKFNRSLRDKRRVDLFKFLIENAKDSGVAPGCDGNYCGQD